MPTLLPPPGALTLLKHTMFSNIITNNEPLDCISLELFEDKFPKIAEKFCSLSTGEKYYKDSCFNIILGLMCQGGDSPCHNSISCSKSMYRELDDENFTLKNMGPRILSMANAGLNTNSSQFWICIAKTEWLGGLWQAEWDISGSILGLGIAKPAISPHPLLKKLWLVFYLNHQIISFVAQESTPSPP